MRLFFALSSAFIGDKTYRPSIQKLAADFRAEADFLSDAPNDADLSEWVSERLDGCDFAFFDATGADADVMYALGVASQTDTAPICLVDRQKHAAARDGRHTAKLAAREFHGPDDFPRKVRLILEERLGPDVVQNKVLEQRILQHIDAKTPKYMRQLARDVGRPMGDVQPIVYALVRQGVVKKIGDKRYTQYLKP